MAQKVLPVQLIGQQTDMWCWAASGEMIMKYLGHDVSQCDEANYRFGRSDCCNDPPPGPMNQNCIVGGWPNFDHWGFNSQTTNWGTALTFAQLQAQIDANKPVGFSWGWYDSRTGQYDSAGHMMVAVGYNHLHWKRDTQMVYINDPWGPRNAQGHHVGDQKWISYGIWVSQTGDHSHWQDYYDVAYRTAPGGMPGGKKMEPVAAGAGGNHKHNSPEELAKEALELIPGLVTAETQAGMGFEKGVTDASELSLGEPLPFYHIGHTSLVTHEEGDDVGELLEDRGELLYPVLRDGEVVSSIVLIKQDDGWAFKSIGGPNLAKALTAARDQHAERSGKAHADYFVVHVPHMYLAYIAHVEDGKLMLTHIHDDQERGFKKHETQSGEEIINTILPAAKQFQSPLPGPDSY